MSLPQLGVGPLQILILRFDAPTSMCAVPSRQTRIGIRRTRAITRRMWIAMLPDQLDGFVSCGLEYLLFFGQIQVVHCDADSASFFLLLQALLALAILQARR